MVKAILCHRVLLVVLAGLLPTRLLSQILSNPVAPGQSTVREQLDVMKISSRLRLSSAGDRQEGRLIFRTSDSIGVSGRVEGEKRFLLADVDSMWVRRHRTGLGLLIGTLVGGAAFLVITSVVDDSGSDYTGLDDLFGGLIWAGSAAVGTGVGALSSHWKRVYP